MELPLPCHAMPCQCHMQVRSRLAIARPAVVRSIASIQTLRRPQNNSTYVWIHAPSQRRYNRSHVCLTLLELETSRYEQIGDISRQDFSRCSEDRLAEKKMWNPSPMREIFTIQTRPDQTRLDFTLLHCFALLLQYCCASSHPGEWTST